jgi:hypothetical protein
VRVNIRNSCHACCKQTSRKSTRTVPWELCSPLLKAHTADLLQTALQVLSQSRPDTDCVHSATVHLQLHLPPGVWPLAVPPRPMRSVHFLLLHVRRSRSAGRPSKSALLCFSPRRHLRSLDSPASALPAIPPPLLASPNHLNPLE